MTTIQEVAKHAAVSMQTVSNVLNGRTSEVGQATRQRVLEAIRALGYQPNNHARGLRSRRSSTVAYLTVDPSAHFLADPFHTVLLSGMADVLRERDYCLLVQALSPERPDESFSRLFRQRRFDAAVVHLSGSQSMREGCVKQLQATRCPFVLVEQRVSGDLCTCVLANNRQGAKEAVAHLHALGHERIAFLTTQRPWPAAEERLLGYRAALKSRRLPSPGVWRVESEAPDVVRASLEERLRREQATAVLCHNDLLAVGALQAARAAGRSVPRDLAVVGFDNFDFSQHVEPPLTTVALPGYDMGRRAAELLLDYLDAGEFTEQEIVFPTTLLRRGTA